MLTCTMKWSVSECWPVQWNAHVFYIECWPVRHWMLTCLMFSEGVIGGSNIEALEVWSLSECWPAQGNADVLKIRQKYLPDNFPVCWLLLHLSRFLTGISRKDMWYYVAYVYNGELISLIGNQRVGIFTPKSEIVFVLSLALIWCRNFQDRTIPVGGDTWPCFCRKEE